MHTAGAGTVRLHHRLRHGQHVIVVSTADARATLTATGLAELAALDVVDGELGAAFTLVRPDGVIALRARCDEVSRVVDYLRHLLNDAALASDVAVSSA